jgi:hypothetical protein
LLSFGVLVVGLSLVVACGGDGEHQADNNLPTRRAKMREVKTSTDRIMVDLKNEAISSVAEEAMKIQNALNAVVDLYPVEHKEQYTAYNKEAQAVALVLATAAKGGNLKEANKQFRNLVPYCGKCHEDCAFMLAPAFPEYEE